MAEVVSEVLSERDALEQAREKAAEAELASIRRSTLSAKQKSALIDRIGKDAYLRLQW